MGLRINTNVEAFNSHRQLVGTSDKLAKSMERLSSGYRINRAADDAAGLAITEKLRGQITGLEQAQRNGQDAISLVQDGERQPDRGPRESEVNMLASEVERTGSTAQFNGIQLLNVQQTISFQVGAMETARSSRSRRSRSATACRHRFTRSTRSARVTSPRSTAPSTPSARSVRSSAPCRTGSTTP